MSERGARVMMSNSDPHNVDENDDFFDNLYKGFHIERIFARTVQNEARYQNFSLKIFDGILFARIKSF